MWYWEEKNKTCNVFIFYGCWGTHDFNRFADEEECKETCEPTYLEMKFPNLNPPKLNQDDEEDD